MHYLVYYRPCTLLPGKCKREENSTFCSPRAHSNLNPYKTHIDIFYSVILIWVSPHIFVTSSFSFQNCPFSFVSGPVECANACFNFVFDRSKLQNQFRLLAFIFVKDSFKFVSQIYGRVLTDGQRSCHNNA